MQVIGFDIFKTTILDLELRDFPVTFIKTCSLFLKVYLKAIYFLFPR